MPATVMILLILLLFGAESGVASARMEKLLGVASLAQERQEPSGSRSFYDLGFYFVQNEDEDKDDFFCRTEGRGKGWLSGASALRQVELLLGFEKLTPDSLWLDVSSKKLVVTGGHDQARFMMQGLIYCKDRKFLGLGGELELVRSSGTVKLMIHLSKEAKEAEFPP